MLEHQGHWKAKVVDVGSFYFNKYYVHVQNERLYITNDYPSILDWLQVDVSSKHRWKYMQFVAIFHILIHGCFMTNYEDMKDLFKLLKVKNVFKKHWSNTSWWRMTEVMHIVLLELPK